MSLKVCLNATPTPVGVVHRDTAVRRQPPQRGGRGPSTHRCTRHERGHRCVCRPGRRQFVRRCAARCDVRRPPAEADRTPNGDRRWNGGAAAALFSTRAHAADAPPRAMSYPVQGGSQPRAGPSNGRGPGHGGRSQFETEVRWWLPSRIASLTPMQNGSGIIALRTSLRRHHTGKPNIDAGRRPAEPNGAPRFR